MLIGLLKSFCI